MTWVRFYEDFDWPQPGFTVAYLAGRSYNALHGAAEAAIAAGKAVPLKAPRKGEVPDGD